MNSNEKNKRSRGCDGKIKHKTLLAVQYYIHSNDKTGIEDYYLCEYCNNYHTTTVPGQKKLIEKRQLRNVKKLMPKGPKKIRFKTGKDGRNQNKK